MGRPAAAPPPQRRRLRITRIGSQGDGAGQDEAGALVHTPFTLPGEAVFAEVSVDRGRLIEQVEPSPERTAPPCPHFGECGGCALQHWAQAPYLAWKASRIADALARERLETEILPPAAGRPPRGRRCGARPR